MFDRKFTIQAFGDLATHGEAIKKAMLESLEVYTTQTLTNESEGESRNIIEISFGMMGEPRINEVAFAQRLAGRVATICGIPCALITCTPMTGMPIGQDGNEYGAEPAEDTAVAPVPPLPEPSLVH